MAKTDVALVAGIAGFLLGGIAAYTAFSMKGDVRDLTNERASDNESIAALGEKVDKVDGAQKELSLRVGRLSSDPKVLWEAINQLQLDVQNLRQGGSDNDDVSPSTAPAAATKPETGKLSREQVAALVQKLFSGVATDAEKAQLSQAMSLLEGEVKERPRDVAAHLELAQMYIAKLFTVPDGPEKGAWAMRAEKEWKTVLDLEPDNWEAHFSLGTSYSYYPDQFNKRPDAIKEFEAARKVQEQATPDPKHAQTYLQLRQLYLKDGKADAAKTVLEAGLSRFPDDEELQKARDGAK